MKLVDQEYNLSRLIGKSPMNLDRPAGKRRGIDGKARFFVVPDEIEIRTFQKTQELRGKYSVAPFELHRKLAFRVTRPSPLALVLQQVFDRDRRIGRSHHEGLA